mgnify:CR=1 FL=1
MLLKFDQNFLKALSKIKDDKLYKRIQGVIENCEEATSLKDINNVKKIIGFRNFYRIKLGQYRIGFELENSTSIRFITILHRKEIYRKFP